mgnify:CR=1 FL=1
MSKILVTGAEGQLGQCFQEVAKEFPIYKLFLESKKTLDITNKISLDEAYRQDPFDGIINCAAYSNVDQAEIEIEKAYKINEHGVQTLATFAEKKNLFLVHFSTDYVFDGSMKMPLKEEDPKNPLNHYANSKLAGEKILSKSNCSHITFRISWLFSPFGNNFVKTILKKSNSKQEIKVVNDQLGSPTYGIDLARVVLDNFTKPKFFDFGCYHFTNKGGISWFEFAKKIIEISKRDCSIKPCLTTEYETLTVRPKYSILDTKRIENHFSLSIPSWENALERCLNKYNLNELV